jgi:hypothetical protein
MRTSVLSDISEVTPRLFVGGKPYRLSVSLLNIDHLLLCAREWQPPFISSKISITRGDLTDSELTTQLAEEALRLGQIAAAQMHSGRVLITCNRGFNRGPLVAVIAFALFTGCPLSYGAELVRKVRKGALSNSSFLGWLDGEGGLFSQAVPRGELLVQPVRRGQRWLPTRLGILC